MKNFLNRVFNNKKSNLEYLKYEDGEVVIVEPDSSVDNTPRLNLIKEDLISEPINKDISQTLQNTNTDAPKERKNLKALKSLNIIVVSILLFVLLNFSFNLMSFFSSKTENFLKDLPSEGFFTISNLFVSDKTSKETEAPSKTGTKGSIGTEQLQTIPQQNDIQGIEKILSLVGDTHNAIISIIAEQSETALQLSRGGWNSYILNSKINRQKITIQNTYKKLSTQKDLFTRYNSEDLYDLEVKRLNKMSDLINELKVSEVNSNIVEKINTFISNDNKNIKSQLTELKSFLDLHHISYVEKNGVLSWQLP